MTHKQSKLIKKSTEGMISIRKTLIVSFNHKRKHISPWTITPSHFKFYFISHWPTTIQYLWYISLFVHPFGMNFIVRPSRTAQTLTRLNPSLLVVNSHHQQQLSIVILLDKVIVTKQLRVQFAVLGNGLLFGQDHPQHGNDVIKLPRCNSIDFLQEAEAKRETKI